MNRKVRVRFAPSPTGPLHIGGVRTALYNYLFARNNNGDFILRIEDTDRARYVDGAEEYIIEALDWCRVNYNEGVGKGGTYGPYRQSERKHIYKKYAEQLVNAGFAYYAFDTPEDLENMRIKLKKESASVIQYCAETRLTMKNSLSMPEEEVKKYLESGKPYVIRIKIPENEDIVVNDIVRGEVVFYSAQLDDKVLFKSDGMPTYHLANVVDDHLMEISHVIRGEEWLPSAPLHVMLYRYLGWEKEMPVFAHLPLLLKPDGKGKLSKRDGEKGGFPVFPLYWTDPKTGDISSGYRESGYLPEALINILALLGWNPGTPQELFTMEELIKEFTLNRVGRSGAKFDPDKARWFNQQYLQRKSADDLAEMLIPVMKEKGITVDTVRITQICELIRDRLTFVSDLWDQSFFFFIPPDRYDEKVISKKWKPETPGIISGLKDKIIDSGDFTSDIIRSTVEEYAERSGVGFGQIMNPLRLALVGGSYGPDLVKIMEILGKEEVIQRIDAALEKI